MGLFNDTSRPRPEIVLEGPLWAHPSAGVVRHLERKKALSALSVAPQPAYRVKVLRYMDDCTHPPFNLPLMTKAEFEKVVSQGKILVHVEIPKDLNVHCIVDDPEVWQRFQLATITVEHHHSHPHPHDGGDR